MLPSCTRVFDPQMELASSVLAAQVAELEAHGVSPEPWVHARHALDASGIDEPDVRAVVEARDLAGLRAIVEGWRSGTRLLPVHDREVLERAMTAYRKSLRVTRLDAVSTLGGGPFSSGRRSGISGITPPPRYPREIWEELARQGRLIACAAASTSCRGVSRSRPGRGTQPCARQARAISPT